jgi:hypothetical protein
MLEFLSNPWPWYAAGPLIGLTVTILLLIGNKFFGISSSMRHICAAVLPAGIPYFQYDWKKELWNLYFVGGITLGAVLAAVFLANPNPVVVTPGLLDYLASFGITDTNGLLPSQLFNWSELLTLRGALLMPIGGFLVGFGTRYAGGCTSGHSIMGLSMLQWPSLVATCCFMAGGFIMTNFILPFILAL